MTTREEQAGEGKGKVPFSTSPALRRMDRVLHTLKCSISKWPKLRDSVGIRRGRTRVGGMGMQSLRSMCRVGRGLL